MPVFWGPEELSALRGSFVLQQVQDRKTNIATDYDEILRAAPAFGRFSREQFLWVRMVVASRNFGVTIAGKKTDAMVPYADMLNHYRPRETRWTFNQKRQVFTIHAINQLRKGEQVYDSYGRKCNSRFLINYGFVAEYNRDDDTGMCHNEVRLLFRLLPPSADPYWAQKRDLLDRADASRPIRVSSNYPQATTMEAFSFLRFAVADGADTQALPFVGADTELGRKRIEPISCTNEAAALRALASMCEAQLGRYPTTLFEDLARLHSGRLRRFTNARNCVVLLRGEKDVLHHWIRMADLLCPILEEGTMEDVERLRLHELREDGDAEQYLSGVVAPLLEREGHGLADDEGSGEFVEALPRGRGPGAATERETGTAAAGGGAVYTL